MKILITGITGFIGKSLKDFFSKEHTIIPFFRGDSFNKIISEKPDVIIHSAAEIYNEKLMFDSNVSLTYNLLMSSMGINYKLFVYIGSSSEYGRKSRPFKESDVLEPTTVYEATKGCGTLLCQAVAREFNKPVVIVRPFSVYGYHEPEHRLIPTLLKAARNNTTVGISQAYHDFIYINDFVQGINKLINHKKLIAGDVINFGTGKQYSNLDVLKTMEKATGKKIRHKKIGKIRSFDGNFWKCDPSYARNRYGIKFPTNLECGLKQYASKITF